MKQVKLVLFLIILNVGCLNEGSNKRVTNNTGDYNNFITNYYNSSNQLIKQETVNIENRNGVLIEIKTLTNSFYNEEGRLKKEIRIKQKEENSLDSDSSITIYKYNKSNELIIKVYIDYNGDTLEIERNNYFKKNNIKRIERTTIKRPLYELEKSNATYDTTLSLIEEQFTDSLKKEIRYYQLKEKEKQLRETEFLDYYKNGKLKKSYTLDFNNDTVQSVIVQYQNGKLKSKKYVLNKLKHITKELYDANGCIEKVITIDEVGGNKDTVFYECDENCNVIKMKW